MEKEAYIISGTLLVVNLAITLFSGLVTAKEQKGLAEDANGSVEPDINDIGNGTEPATAWGHYQKERMKHPPVKDSGDSWKLYKQELRKRKSS